MISIPPSLALSCPSSPPTPSSEPSERSNIIGQAQSVQAGRSSTNLAAHAAARSLQETNRSSSARPSARPQPQTETAHSVIESPRTSSVNHVTIDSGGSWPSLNHASSSTNIVDTSPDDANQTTPSDNKTLKSDGVRVASGCDISLHAEHSRVSTRSTSGIISNDRVNAHSRVPRNHSSPSVRPQTPTSPNLTQESSSRQTLAPSFHHLGLEYTRYPNPFATRNNSQISLPNRSPHFEPASPFLHSNSDISPADLQQSLAEPFLVNPKRLSNPFRTTPGTPSDSIGGRDDEKAVIAVSREIAITDKTSPAGKSLVGPRVSIAEFAHNQGPAYVQRAKSVQSGFRPYLDLDDLLGKPGYSMPLFVSEKEDDDDMHMPQWDDDARFRPRFRDHFRRDNIVSTLGMLFIILGLLCIFVVLPVVSFTGTSIINYFYQTPLDQMPNPYAPEPWATVNDRKYPHLRNIRTGLIDPDTPKSAKKIKGVNGDDYILVFSDEFNQKNRTFYPGDDPYWYGGDFWYGATQDLEWYDPDAINTGDGVLYLQLDKFLNHGLDYRSGMLNSWNQLCFKGGIFEVSMSLPGPAGRHLWWPGVWTMGNLGKPGYLATTDGLWPYTYQDCDAGITPNQSMTDGLSHLPGQRLPSCTCANEDHPTPGRGRGAPEIDIAEVSADWGGLNIGVATQSFQVAPFDIWYYPNYDFMQTPNYSLSMVNTYTGGPFQQAVSTTSMLNNKWYDGKQYQKYSFEYVPGGSKSSYIAWKIGDTETMRFDARAIGPNGNIGQRLIAEEPLSMILNFGFSKNWVLIDEQYLKFPAIMRVDYVRWYQKSGEVMVTCDPPGYETTQYIADHPEAYNNPNVTLWADAGYRWPKNTLMHGCKA